MSDVTRTRGTEVLAFGIPTLDALLGQRPRGLSRDGSAAPPGYQVAQEKDEPESSTFCIIGPDGTGKSLFALHLVSFYWMLYHGQAKLLYASTDLSVGRAQRIWSNFCLEEPQKRWEALPFKPAEAWVEAVGKKDAGRKEVKLRPYRPLELNEFSRYLQEPATRRSGEIAFIDLESTTAGDDWALLNNILATLDEPQGGKPRHLLVIDAVEGLETMVGERDAFGQIRLRRSRIAQIVRAADI